MKKEMLDSQSNAQSSVDFLYFGVREMSNVICKYTFWKTNQVVAENCTVMLEPFINANYKLGGNAVIFRINRGADDAGEAFIYAILPGNNKKNPLFFRVIFGAFVYQKQITSFHFSISSICIFWYESTSSASAFNSSAYFSKSSLSLAAISSGEFADDLAGVKAIIVLPVGTSLGTVIRRSAGISIV